MSAMHPLWCSQAVTGKISLAVLLETLEDAGSMGGEDSELRIRLQERADRAKALEQQATAHLVTIQQVADGSHQSRYVARLGPDLPTGTLLHVADIPSQISQLGISLTEVTSEVLSTGDDVLCAFPQSLEPSCQTVGVNQSSTSTCYVQFVNAHTMLELLRCLPLSMFAVVPQWTVQL